MPTLTLKGLPDHVYRVLKARAAANHRSLNSEVLIRLERSVGAKPADVKEMLAHAAEVRSQFEAAGVRPFSEAELTAAKHAGRP